MQNSDQFTKEDSEVLRDAEKWFKFYVHLPKVLTIIWAILVFLAGLIISIAFEEFIFLLIWFGEILTPLVYVFTKIAVSYPILQVYHLKKIGRILLVKNQSNN